MQKKLYKTEVRPFNKVEEIKAMMDWFENKKMYHWHLAFMIGLLLGRRVGDILSMKWRDVYYKNGKMRDKIEIIEQKTGKQIELVISPAMAEEFTSYIERMGINTTKEWKNYIIPSESKSEFDRRVAELPMYQDGYIVENYEEVIQEWAEAIGKTINVEATMKEFENLCNAHKRGKSEMNFSEFLMEKEWTMVIKSQSAAYRKQFKLAAEENRISNVSTHSCRKTFAYWSVKLHPYDMTTIDALQVMFNHADRQTTIHYAWLDKEKTDGLFIDMGEFVSDVKNGKDTVINSSPVVSMRAEDVRNLILKATKDGADGKNIEEVLNDCIKIMENLRIS